jgi:hypothetical protein
VSGCLAAARFESVERLYSAVESRRRVNASSCFAIGSFIGSILARF